MVSADFIVGILGNIVSIATFASPIGTFLEIAKKKSSENYKGVPYVTTLVSTSLWTFYGSLDPDDGILIVTVNAVGIISQALYLLLFLLYASKETKVKYFGLVMVALLFVGMVITVTLSAFHGDVRRTFIGVLCVMFTIAMYAAPLSIMKTVIQTKSVNYMPFPLSLSLFVNAAVWFTFAMLVKDLYVLVPNAVGILLGSLQLVIYVVYKNKSSSSDSVDAISDQKASYVDSNSKDIEQGKEIINCINGEIH